MGTHTSQLNSKQNSFAQPSVTPTTETTLSVPPHFPVDSYSAVPVTHSNSSLNSSVKSLKNNNGITGIYLSETIAKIVVDFWRENIDVLSMQDQLEIGCSIFFGMASIDKKAKKILKSKLNNQVKIEYLSLKFLDNFAYLTRNLLTKDINLYLSLSILSITHKNMGVKMQQFNSMLTSLHETFVYYFPMQYTTQVKYAVDKVFTVAAKIIANEPLNKVTIKDPSHNISFLESLDTCLNNEIGKGYLFEYFQQKSCHEIVKFLELSSKMKFQNTDEGKYIIARNIVKQCILPNAINNSISNKTIQPILECMHKLETLYLRKVACHSNEDFTFDVKLFADVEYDVYTNIMQIHWSDFVCNVEHIVMNDECVNKCEYDT